jgi:hypothetical protein
MSTFVYQITGRIALIGSIVGPLIYAHLAGLASSAFSLTLIPVVVITSVLYIGVYEIPLLARSHAGVFSIIALLMATAYSAWHAPEYTALLLSMIWSIDCMAMLTHASIHTYASWIGEQARMRYVHTLSSITLFGLLVALAYLYQPFSTIPLSPLWILGGATLGIYSTMAAGRAQVHYVLKRTLRASSGSVRGSGVGLLDLYGATLITIPCAYVLYYIITQSL